MCLMNAKRKFLDSIEFTVSSHMTVFHCNRFSRIVYIRSQDGVIVAALCKDEITTFENEKYIRDIDRMYSLRTRGLKFHMR